MLVEQNWEAWAPITPSDKVAVREQLDRLLADAHFSHSKRYPQFLRYAVDQVLSGTNESLKERTVGIEVFGKSPDYDTYADPIVRVTATEIRKRISQYYSSPDHQNEMRLDLPAGSYLPRFYLPSASPTQVKHEDKNYAAPETIQPVPPIAAVATWERPFPPLGERSFRVGRRRWIAGLVILALVVLASLLWSNFRSSSLNAFWSPVIRSSAPVIICVADQNQEPSISLKDANDPLRQTVSRMPVNRPVTLAMDDTVPLLAVGGVLQSNKRDYRVKGQAFTTLADLRQGPDVLIGAYDNGWTLRLTQSMRFHFANDPPMNRLWIEDRDNPSARRWVRDLNQISGSSNYTDYALVARFFDPITNQYVVVAAGLGNQGTAAAGEFLASVQSITEAMRGAPAHWGKENMEFVLETSVIGNHTGPPRVVASQFW